MIDDDVIDAAGALLAERTGLRPTPATRARLESSRPRSGPSGPGCPLDGYVSHLGGDLAETQALIDAPHRAGDVVLPGCRRTSTPLLRACCPAHRSPHGRSGAPGAPPVRSPTRSPWRSTRRASMTGGSWRPISPGRRSSGPGAGRYRRARAPRSVRRLAEVGTCARDGDGWLVDPTAPRSDLGPPPQPAERLVPLWQARRRPSSVATCSSTSSATGSLASSARLQPASLTDGVVLFVGGSESLWHVPAGYAAGPAGRRLRLPHGSTSPGGAASTAHPPTAQPLPTAWRHEAAAAEQRSP